MMVVLEMLNSKKFIAAILAAILAFAGFVYGMTESQIAVIVSPLGFYIFGQGLADFGKEAK